VTNFCISFLPRRCNLYWKTRATAADIGDKNFLISAFCGQKSFGNGETRDSFTKYEIGSRTRRGKEGKRTKKRPGIDSEILYVKAT